MCKRLAKGFLYLVFCCCVTGGLLFYIFIMSGTVKITQELWVTSAMTTMSHKWLATSFIPNDVIRDIMERTAVSDAGMDTIVGSISLKDELLDHGTVQNAASDPLAEPDNSEMYLEQGYEQLEDGLYLKHVSGDLWQGYVMLVEDPDRVKLTQTNQQGICGQTVMDMVAEAGGIAGINGGGFCDGPNYDSNGGKVAGLLIVDGELISPSTPDNSSIFNIIGLADSGQLILQHNTSMWALENGIHSAVEFSPFLIVNGEGTIKSGTGGWGIAPRTAIGQRETGEILFLVIDGRQVGYSVGVDIRVLQDVLLEEGCINAAMMDGGSSTVMVYDGAFVNKPSLGHERYINNCWVVMPKED